MSREVCPDCDFIDLGRVSEFSFEAQLGLELAPNRAVSKARRSPQQPDRIHVSRRLGGTL